MPVKLQPTCLICKADNIIMEDDITKTCDRCGTEVQSGIACQNGHFVCHMCRQKAARDTIISHCLESRQEQPYPLLLELMQLPGVAIHGPEHHLLLTAALLTAYCNEMGRQEALQGYLAEANMRSLGVPGGACGHWGICGAAIGSGIYMSMLTESSPYATAEWKASGQLVARCADAISGEGGPRCCKRDSFLSLQQAVAHSNNVLGTHFALPESIQCAFYPNNQECKRMACPFFPVQK